MVCSKSFNHVLLALISGVWVADEAVDLLAGSQSPPEGAALPCFMVVP
jgi:hypothetical protein